MIGPRGEGTGTRNRRDGRTKRGPTTPSPGGRATTERFHSGDEPLSSSAQDGSFLRKSHLPDGFSRYNNYGAAVMRYQEVFGGFEKSRLPHRSHPAHSLSAKRSVVGNATS